MHPRSRANKKTHNQCAEACSEHRAGKQTEDEFSHWLAPEFCCNDRNAIGLLVPVDHKFRKEERENAAIYGRIRKSCEDSHRMETVYVSTERNHKAHHQRPVLLRE